MLAAAFAAHLRPVHDGVDPRRMTETVALIHGRRCSRGRVADRAAPARRRSADRRTDACTAEDFREDHVRSGPTDVCLTKIER